MAIGKTTQTSNKVYFGPSATTYPLLDSLAAGKQMDIIWRESTWFYVEYAAPDGMKRRGYISSANITLLSGSPTSQNLTYSNRYVITAGKTYTGPQPSTYVSAGSTELGELVQYLGYKENGYALIEYSISSTQRKRAYFYANNLSTSFNSLVSNFCSIAKGEVGIQDPQENDNTKYGVWYGSNGIPWCAIFASWCANQAGILTEANNAPVPRVKKASSVDTMRTWYSNNNRLVTANVSADVKVGDLAFFESHVGIVVSVSGNTITLVEGNCGKNVAQYTYTNFSGASGTITSIGINHA